MISRLLLCPFLLCLLFVIPKGLVGQDNTVYRLDAVGDAVTVGAGMGLVFLGHGLEARQVKLDGNFVPGLDPLDVNGFDRPATRLWSPTADRLSNFTLIGGGLGSIAMGVLDPKSRREWFSWGVMFVQTVMITDGFTFTVKSTSNRIRPYAYNPVVPLDEKVQKKTWESFFSGHASLVSAVSFFGAKIYHDHHPGSNWRYVVWGGAGLVSASTAWLRVRAGRHFPTDVMAGMAAGALVGILVPEIHRRKKKPDSAVRLEMGPAFGMRGLRIGMRF